jgi:hypothetical protein
MLVSMLVNFVADAPCNKPECLPLAGHLGLKYWTRMKRPDSGKHSSLFCSGICDGGEKFSKTLTNNVNVKKLPFFVTDAATK